MLGMRLGSTFGSEFDSNKKNLQCTQASVIAVCIHIAKVFTPNRNHRSHTLDIPTSTLSLEPLVRPRKKDMLRRRRRSFDGVEGK